VAYTSGTRSRAPGGLLAGPAPDLILRACTSRVQRVLQTGFGVMIFPDNRFQFKWRAWVGTCPSWPRATDRPKASQAWPDGLESKEQISCGGDKYPEVTRSATIGVRQEPGRDRHSHGRGRRNQRSYDAGQSRARVVLQRGRHSARTQAAATYVSKYGRQRKLLGQPRHLEARHGDPLRRNTQMVRASAFWLFQAVWPSRRAVDGRRRVG